MLAAALVLVGLTRVEFQLKPRALVLLIAAALQRLHIQATAGCSAHFRAN